MSYAYVAVTSLMVTIEQYFLQPDPCLLQDTKQIETLHKKLGYMQEFLKGSEKESARGEATKDLEAQIRDVALEAEDIIELYLVKDSVNENPSHGFLRQLFHHPKSTDHSRIKFHQSLQKVIKCLDTVCGEVMRVKSCRSSSARYVERRNTLPNGSSRRAKKPSRQSSKFDNAMVGHAYELDMVKDKLTRHSSKKLEILSIYGMGGLGKTTFCLSVYDDLLIVSHFDKRAWITVSQEYTIGELLLGLLRSVVELTDDEIKKQNEEQLAERLYKSLKGNRYLIVVDDVWTTDAWDDLKRYFPDDGNGSRIMLTTRLKEVATYASSSKSPHQLRFLNTDESCHLFYEKLFKREYFPREFVKIGKDVAKKCQGLPLAIVVVASLLSKLNKRLDEWEKVAGSINSLLKLDLDQQCEGILSLSYNHLPHCLKACFLYFVIFPEDSEIPVKKLIRLWIAEGFLKVDGDDKTLEEEAEECLLDLIDRSLVLVSKRSLHGKIKTCKVHDLLSGFCLAKSRNDNFVFVQSEHTNASIRASQKGHRRVSLQARASNNARDLYFDQHTLKIARSLIFSEEGSFIRFIFRKIECSHLKLLRVLDLPVYRLIVLPEAIVGLVHLRYLAFTTYNKFPLPITIFQLQNLQTLHIRSPPNIYIYLPNTIWNMPRLRHLLLARSFLSDPPPSAEIDGKKCMVLENLQTFSGLCLRSWTEEVLKGTPNIKKLRIFCNYDGDNFCREGPSWFDNLACLNELETLSFVAINSPRKWMGPVLASFPSSIKKLTIKRTFLAWKDMDIVGRLPNLEVLKAIDGAFSGLEWEPALEGFCRLKLLLLREVNVRLWKATADHFPCLEHLILKNCSLHKIPDGFVDINTLQLIELHNCTKSAVASAQSFKRERQEYGGDMLDVRVYRGPLLKNAVLSWEGLDPETPLSMKKKATSFFRKASRLFFAPFNTPLNQHMS